MASVAQSFLPKGVMMPLLEGVIDQKRRKGPEQVTCVRWSSVAKLAYYFEKEIQSSRILDAGSRSILVVTSNRERIYELLSESDFQDLWGLGDALVLPVFINGDEKKTEDWHRANPKIQKTVYTKLVYQGPWEENRKYLPANKIMDLDGKYYTNPNILQHPIPRPGSPGGSSAWKECTENIIDRLPHTVNFFNHSSIRMWLETHVKSGGLARWRLDPNKFQSTKMAIVLCTYSDVLRHKDGLAAAVEEYEEFKFDAVILDEDDILAMPEPTEQSKKRSRSGGGATAEGRMKNGYFENLPKLVGLSSAELCVRVVSNPVGVETVPMEWDRSSVLSSRKIPSEDKETQRLKLKLEFSKFLKSFRKSANARLQPSVLPGSCGNRIEVLRESGFGQEESSTPGDLWQRICEFRDKNHSTKLQETEKTFGKDWWRRFYEDIDKATWGLCFST